MHSHFSLRYGLLSPEEVVMHYLQGGFPFALLADVNNTSAQLDFLRISQAKGIKAVLGVDFRNGAKACYLVIARNHAGMREVNEHLSHHLHAKLPFPDRAPAFEHCLVIYPAPHPAGQAEYRPNEFIQLEPEYLNRFRAGKYQDLPLMALSTMTFRNKADFNTHRLLRSIDLNSLLSHLPREAQAPESNRYRSLEELQALYEDAPGLLEESLERLEACAIDYTFGKLEAHNNKKTYTGSPQEDQKLIRHLIAEGLEYRYPQADQKVHERIEKELDLIAEKQFTAYFLINWDITSYARRKGFFYVGRGSGANSIVAYILRITDVDPIELDLYFERFINLYRQNPPDFDIDFSWTDRDEVTRYIFERFPHVCLLGAYSTFQYRAVVRELGKVFGLPKHEIDRLASGRQAEKEDELAQLVLKYGKRIEGFPNMLAIHAAGILITEQSIHQHVATFLPPKGFPTTQFDMHIAEDAGFYKFDILSQRGLSKIKDCVSLVAENQAEATSFDVHDLARFKADPAVKQLLRTADAVGCFYVESPAMRTLMKKLQVDNYLGLVAASSVIRPGVARSGMMREYILRYRFPEKRKEAHPLLLEIMPETFGVMVYQEDVIKVAHLFAGLSLAEADVLRRGMSGKFRSREEFEKARQSFFDNCAKKGHSQELSTEVWRQIESFAGYAFAKGHSASYAVESFQSLFLKAHFPLEYMVATINNEGGFYSTELYVHEARMKGAEVEAPCVNEGRKRTHIIGKRVILGFDRVKGLDERTMDRLLKARERDGIFNSLEDLIERAGIGLEQALLLIRSGALRFTGKNKKELQWQAHFLLGQAPPSSSTASLFRTPVRMQDLPSLHQDPLDDAYDEIELLGFPLCSPFELLENKQDLPTLRIDQVPNFLGKEVRICGYLVTVKPTSTVKGERMYFGTFIDLAGEWIDTVHFPPVAKRFPFRGKGVYVISGKVVEEFDCYSIEVSQMEKASLRNPEG